MVEGSGLLHLPVKRLLLTNNELGGSLDLDEKAAFGVKSKTLYEEKCPSPLK
jgi:hypothetical protein